MIAATADTRAMRVISRTGRHEPRRLRGVRGRRPARDRGRPDRLQPPARPVGGLPAGDSGGAARRAPGARGRLRGRTASTRSGGRGTRRPPAWSPTRRWRGSSSARPSQRAERRGHVAAAAMFERAAGLTPANEPRARRLYLAAHSAWLAGQGDRALRLLDDATSAGADDDLLRADISHLQSRIELRRNATAGVVDRLVAEAERVEPLDAARAGAMLATAVEATPPDARLELARRAASLAAGRDDAAGLLTSSRSLARAARSRRSDGGSRAPRPRKGDARPRTGSSGTTRS